MKKNIFIISGAIILLTGTILIALKYGTLPVSWRELCSIFSEPDTLASTVVLELRLPRTAAALLAGAALAAAGVILQKILDNDLASPEILGISGGAGFAGLLLLFSVPQYAAFLNAAAFCGAMTAAFLISMAAWKRILSPVRLILAGVAIGALFSAAGGILLLFNSDNVSRIMEFALGGFSGRTMNEIFCALPFFTTAFVMTIFLPEKLDILSLGTETALSLGVSPGRDRLLAVATAALLAATAVSLAGLLGFVGLMAPHIAGKLLNSRRAGILLIMAVLTGSQLTLTADILARLLFSPRELPCGSLLSAAGALFFLLLLQKHREEA